MEVTNTFIPTAGTVGIFSMVTYFFLVVAAFAFLGTFIISLITPRISSLEQRNSTEPNSFILTTISTVIAGFTYYLIQSYYHDILAEMATVSDPTDRQTLIRESYNAIGQYRYIAWFITIPLLLVQLIALLRLPFSTYKRQLLGLIMATLFMVFASYIGHEQLSFDNEIETIPKLVWGLIALIDYVTIVFTLNKLWKEAGSQAHPAFRLSALTVAGAWGIYFIGYFLTLAPIDFNWIHLAFTITDLISLIGIGIVVYLVNSNRWQTNI
ncbi:bacteriorhodopsin [Spirosoma litoris]